MEDLEARVSMKGVASCNSDVRNVERAEMLCDASADPAEVVDEVPRPPGGS